MSYPPGPAQPALPPNDDSWPAYGPPSAYGPQPGYGPPPPYAAAPILGPSYGLDPAYRPDPAYRVYGPQPPGYGPQPGGWDLPYGPSFPGPPSSTNVAPAFAAAALFLACAVQSFVLAFSGWSGDGNPHLMAALVGIVFSGDITGNVDFAIAATMTVACSTTTFALAMFARLNFVRWLLAGISGVVTVYYFFALLYIAANGGAQYVAVPTVAMLLWAAATAVALLPPTARAMRGRGTP